MDIIVTVSHDKLRKLNISRDHVHAAIYEALDKAVLPTVRTHSQGENYRAGTG